MTRLLIHTQKGGVGKTTTSANLAAALLRMGHARNVVLADLDPQQHLTTMFGGAAPGAHLTASAWLAGGTGPLAPVAPEPGLWLIPGDDAATDPDSITPGDTGADWTIVDSAPGWSARVAALSLWADLILCPLEPDFLGLSGVGRLLARLEENGVGHDRLRFLLCRYNPRLSLHQEVRGRLADRFGETMLLPVEIRTTIKLAEAAGQGGSIFACAPDSTGAQDHRKLADCLVRQAKPERTAA